MYKQIGIDVNNEEQIEGLTEADLEDRILIKSILDYNEAKFSRTEEIAIDGIVRDVFIDKL